MASIRGSPAEAGGEQWGEFVQRRGMDAFGSTSLAGVRKKLEDCRKYNEDRSENDDCVAESRRRSQATRSEWPEKFCSSDLKFGLTADSWRLNARPTWSS